MPAVSGDGWVYGPFALTAMDGLMDLRLNSDGWVN